LQRDLRLFFEYWAIGTREPGIRQKVGAALDRYRTALRAFAQDALQAAPLQRSDVTPEGLSAVAVSLISGGAVQWMVDPEAFDMEGYLGTVKSIMEQLLAPA
jgi:hypothetical protein